MVSGAAVAYCVAGGLIAYSGFKGASIAATVKGGLTGNLGNVPSASPPPTVTTGGTIITPGPTGGGGLGARIVTLATGYVGAPYVLGGTTPAGWDCSGFTKYVYDQVGITGIPRTSEQQYAWASPVKTPELGTLVFAQFPGEVFALPGHVGIYIGNGSVISAQDPASGTGVSTVASWEPYIIGYGNPPGINLQ